MHKSLTRRYAGTLLSATLLALTAGCTKDSATVSAADVGKDTPVAVSFDTYLQNSRQSTRGTYPAAPVGMIDDAQLKTSGFGVFAQYTENTPWATYNKEQAFNFMWNQQVRWNDALTGTVTRWTYSPVKYWPNDNQPADDQDDHSGTNPAQGSRPHSYLSFFAYAPYVTVAEPGTGFNMKDVDSNKDGKPDHDGIVAVGSNTTNAGATTLYYRTSVAKPFDADESIDLLWATAQDLYKTKPSGEGSFKGAVNLVFKHALSLFTVTVQGLFDHANNDDTSDIYPSDRDAYTKILVESVDFSGSPLFREGTLYLTQFDGTLPRWEVESSKKDNISVNAQNVNPTFTNRYLDGTWMKYWDEALPASCWLKDKDYDGDGDEDEDDALALFNALPMGVSHTEVPLDYTNWDPAANNGAGGYEYKYYMVLPNDKYRTDHPEEKMTVRMVYYVITYDERLTLPRKDYPKYFSIVKNDVTATFDNFSFETGKKYKLRLQPGLTSAKFEVTVVDSWDTPLTLDPEVVDWYTTTTEFNVE